MSVALAKDDVDVALLALFTLAERGQGEDGGLAIKTKSQMKRVADWFTKGGSATEKSLRPFDPTKHPRGGDPEHPGRFSSGSGKHPHSDQPTNAGSPSAEDRRMAADWGNIEAEHQERLANDPEYRRQDEERRERERRAATPPSSAADRSPVHKSLEKARVRRADHLRDSTNETALLTLEDGTKAVFKPRSGETPDPRAGRRGVPQGTQYRREIAASRVAEVLGFTDLVPTTTVRDQAGDIGSAQVYVDGAEEAASSSQMFDGPEDAARAAAFDYLIGHLDRHKYNWLLKGEKLQLIDNGLSFPTHYDWRDFFNMRFLHHAVDADLALPDMSGHREAWPEVAKALEHVGLEPEAIALAEVRFRHLVSGEYTHLSQLPSLLDPEGSLANMTLQERDAR